MTRPRELKNPRTISVVVDGDIYEKFIDQLPRRVGISEAIRELIASEVAEQQKEKNLNALDKSAVQVINTKLSEDFKLSQRNKQPTIDFFCLEREDLPKLVNNVREKHTLGFMEGQCKEFLKYSKVRMNRF